MKIFDYLVIGSGIAGLVFAIEASKFGKVAVVTKKKLRNCNTDYAQGGIAAVLTEQDTFDEHIEDTFVAGAELGKKKIIRQIVEEGPALIQYLIDLGTEFTAKRDNLQSSLENLSLTREGGHSKPRVAYANDSTGHLIMEALIKNCEENENISLFEDHLAVDLITQHHIPQLEEFIPEITCWGAYVMNNKTNNIEIFRAKKTMLATGGAGLVYKHNTNPDVTTGDGLAMAKLAGARLANMEFVQFHPTAFYSHINKTFLVSEALRGEGAILKLANGETFMEKYHKNGCLAPRDIVSRAIEKELRKTGKKYLFLDATGIEPEKLKKHFPYIDRKCKKQGVDFTKEPIPVTPAAHYFCGGILSSLDGETDIKSLYAAGEVACTGLHGANRLASNSLLESLVVAYRAANNNDLLEDVKFPEIPKWQSLGDFNENEWVVIANNKEIIGTIMQGYVGINRSRRLLKYALLRIDNILREINNFYQHNSINKDVIETRNIAIVARIIIVSALARKESRGAHFVTDFPERDNSTYQKDTII
ncbi:MAG: L-aspartate oxidase [Candidatus Cloacimonetes bacterium 4572_65]|nr:MAG: L-aspartate oxidase [Candidatus Cloacimonetes bacterium 4572_65]